MLERGISVNVYMFHGGTNFGFWNGANAFEPHPYQPTTTSYDYQAALDETGTPTSKYHRFREIIVRHTRFEAPPIPQSVSTIDLPPFTLGECASLLDTLGEPVECPDPVPMEALDQSLGFILYRTRLDSDGPGRLAFDDVRDYAVIMLDGEAVGHIDRRLGQRDLVFQARRGSRLDILVENCGRINYGPRFSGERKGVIGSVRWEQRELRGWQIYCLPFETVEPAAWTRALVRGPSFFRGTFDVAQAADTFLDMGDLRKGALWINGRNLGRFWDIGPQRSLYVPGVWLRSGRNEAVALDLFERRSFPTLRSYEHMRSAP